MSLAYSGNEVENVEGKATIGVAQGNHGKNAEILCISALHMPSVDVVSNAVAVMLRGSLPLSSGCAFSLFCCCQSTFNRR